MDGLVWIGSVGTVVVRNNGRIRRSEVLEGPRVDRPRVMVAGSRDERQRLINSHHPTIFLYHDKSD